MSNFIGCSFSNLKLDFDAKKVIQLQKFKLKLTEKIYLSVRWVGVWMDGKAFALSIVHKCSLRNQVLVHK